MNTHPVFEALRNSPDACVCSVLRKAARTSTRMYDGVLAPSGLTIAQVSVLAALYYTRSIPMKKLARRLVMERTTLTRNLGPLERRNFIELVENRDDRRILDGQPNCSGSGSAHFCVALLAGSPRQDDRWAR